MKKIQTIVVDDERHSRERILNLLNEYDNVSIIDSCKNGKEAIASIKTKNPDLVFLDIQLKDLTGFEVLKGLGNERWPIIIFVTAFNEYAIKAFDFFAFDYLLKPFEDERFHVSMQRVEKEIEIKQGKSFSSKLSEFLRYMEGEAAGRPGAKDKTKLPIKQGSKIEFIQQDTIQYITASGYYAEIFTIERKFLIRDSLTNLISRLQSNFVRVHRSTIINIDHIKELEYTAYGDIDAIMNNGETFRISKSYKKSFQKMFNI